MKEMKVKQKQDVRELKSIKDGCNEALEKETLAKLKQEKDNR
jgi:hypothetical protein